MADPGSLYQALQKISTLDPWRHLSGEGSAADGSPLGGQQLFSREILAAVLAFAGELDSPEMVRDAIILPEKLHELSPGCLVGRTMVREFQGGDLGLQVFFNAHKMVSSLLREELGKIPGNMEEERRWFVILEGFIGDLAAGFSLERMRLVKTISRRRQLEARRYILQEKKRYAAIFYQMEEPAFVVDRDLRLLDVNPACEKFFGMSAAQIVGSHCCDVIGQGFCGECPLQDILSNGRSFSNFEITLPVRTDPEAKEEGGEGPMTLLLAGAALGEGAEAGNNGGIVIIQDITERKSIELELDEYRHWLEDFVDERTEELLVANERLQDEIRERRRIERQQIQTSADLKRSNAELEQFAQVASHDLREPLMLVASFAERLVKGYGAILDERGRDYLQRMIKATRKLQELVDALLQLSRVSTRAVELEPLDMNELVRDVVSDLGELISRVGARVEVDQLQDLTGDAIQMSQLFQNLIANALKYHRQGIAPLVTISSRIVGDICEISVEDNGIGFNEEDFKKIFEPFVRLHGRDVYDGSGMGLTTCQKIVNRHGGEIVAHSKPGDGAVFIIRLPLHH